MSYNEDGPTWQTNTHSYTEPTSYNEDGPTRQTNTHSYAEPTSYNEDGPTRQTNTHSHAEPTSYNEDGPTGQTNTHSYTETEVKVRHQNRVLLCLASYSFGSFQPFLDLYTQPFIHSLST